MPNFRPATLIELIDDEPSGRKIDGQAIMRISRNERGSMEASGTFKAEGALLKNRFEGRTFQYEGLAYEATKEDEIRVLVFVMSVQGDLYELEALTEPVVIYKVADEPAALLDPLEHRD